MCGTWAGKMSKKVKVLSTKPDDGLSSTLEPTWWQEGTDSCKLFSDLHMGATVFVPKHVYMYMNSLIWILIFKKTMM